MPIRYFIFTFFTAFMFTAAPAHALVLQAPAPEPGQVEAPAASPYACTEGFTLDKTATGLHLHGQLAMPTPGYRYTFDQDDAQPTTGVLTGSLEIDTPDGATMQVVSPLDIDINMQAEGDVQLLTVSIDKEFDWGPDKITCQKPGMTPATPPTPTQPTQGNPQ